MTLPSFAARLCFSLLLAGGVAAASAQSLAGSDARRGFLYEISKGEQRGLLMGTIHVGRAEWFPLPSSQQARLDQATRIVLEADLGRADAVAAAVTRYALYPAGSAGLAGELPPAIKTRVAQAIAAAGIDAASAWRMKPWLLASTLALREADAAGYSTQVAVESQLIAQARGRPVGELEGVELQFRLFDAATPAVQQAFLVETLDSVANGAARREVSEIARAWANSDEAAVRTVLAQMQADPAPGARFMAEQLITGRHATMLERIEYFTQQGGLPLVAVGSLHLFGAQGLIEQLRRRGWRVTRV